MLSNHEAQGLETHKAGRRLTLDQEQDIARVYAAGSASNGEIRQRFEISDPTLYRVLQKHKVPLHRRGALIASANGVGRQAPSTGQQFPKQRATRTMKVSLSRAPKTAASISDVPVGQFRIVFRGERVFDALDMQDALRQAQAVGALDVVAISRAN